MVSMFWSLVELRARTIYEDISGRTIFLIVLLLLKCLLKNYSARETTPSPLTETGLNFACEIAELLFSITRTS